MVSGAVQGVKKLCALVREAKEAGQEVADLTSQVTGYVGKVLEHTQELKQAEVEIKKNPPKGKSLQVLAFDEVSRKMELKKQYAELRQMIIYELGLPGGFWADFEETLHRLELEQAEALAQAEQELKDREWQRRARQGKLQDKAIEVLVVVLAVGYLVVLAWATVLHRSSQLDVWLA
jgi:hypothetical protein